MDWNSPFIVYRIVENGALEEVFYATDLKKAKYWLNYIAQTGDVLCRTPAHPRHEETQIKYWSHKDPKGQICSDIKQWQEMGKSANCLLDFPEKQYGTP